MAHAIISRGQALAQGLKLYYTGKPCSHGHLSERYVSCKRCIACERERSITEAEAMRAKVRTWKAANKERRDAYEKAYWAERREAQRAIKQRWAEANPEAYRARKARRRAHLSRAEGSHTAGDIRRIYQEQEGRCALCSTEVGRAYHVDHIKPLARGGSNWPDNLQILCPPCNLRKGASLL